MSHEKFYFNLFSCVVQEGEEDEDVEIEISESLQFTFDTIRDATDDFAASNKLGQGGFGTVYKVSNAVKYHLLLSYLLRTYYSWLIYFQGRLPNGQEIGVKRLSRDSGQGDLEFKNEVVLVAKLQHRNLVRLLGFCIEGRERLLVYEFVQNKSLDYFIFGRC